MQSPDMEHWWFRPRVYIEIWLFLVLVVIALFLLCSCSFNKPLRITMLRIDVEKCKLILDQENPDSVKSASETPTVSLVNIDEIIDSILSDLIVGLLKMYPFVELNFVGLVNFMNVESESEDGTAELYDMMEKFIAGMK